MSPSSAPIHGNYHGYYTKRPFSSDARLAVLPTELFVGTRVLDVGVQRGLGDLRDWLADPLPLLRNVYRLT